jgi:hypothetical protein
MVQSPEMQQALAERYLAMLARFVATIREAVVNAKDQKQAKLWQEKALPSLERRISLAEQGKAHFLIGNQQPLIRQAMNSRFLARDLDGHSFAFAGEEMAARLKEQQRLAVIAAWQFCEATGAV